MTTAKTKVEEMEIMEEATEEVEYLFEGGPTVAYIEELKEQHGFIYLTEVEEDEFFVWRPLKRQEFKEIMAVEGADAMYREERVCEKCVLWPQNYDFVAMSSGKAGIPTTLSEFIMEKSGFATKTGAIML